MNSRLHHAPVNKKYNEKKTQRNKYFDNNIYVMKINNLLKYGLRFIFLQAVLTFVTIWYFDNYLFVSPELKYEVYLSLVEDRERFYQFFPLRFVTIDTVLALLIFIFLIILYTTNFYTYVNELNYTFKRNYLDEYLNIYLLWCSFLFSFLLLFRIFELYRSNLIIASFIVPTILFLFRNSEVISLLLGRSVFKENYISINLDKNSSLRNLRIMKFRNEVKTIKLDLKDKPSLLPKKINSINKESEVNLIIINLDDQKTLPKDVENYLINLNKKVLIISNNKIKFKSNFIYREENFENYFFSYFNNDIQYGSKYIIKRIFDIFSSVILLILLSPFLVLLLIFLLIVDGWPPIITQKRVGLHGKIFNMYKFRSMYHNTHYLRDNLSSENSKTGPLFKLDDDPRLIKGAKTIRRFSLDELPQLINVIKGDMSLVGPRPLFDTDTKYFDTNYMRRLNVLPGMTGLLQINDRNTDDFKVWFKHDIEYIENWNFYLDLKILLKTIPSLFNKSVQGK